MWQKGLGCSGDAVPGGAHVKTRTTHEADAHDGKEIHRTTTVKTMSYSGTFDGKKEGLLFCYDSFPNHLIGTKNIDGLLQDCSASCALAMEIPQSFTKPSIG